jgi:aspartyl-tRNA synthetase
MPAAQERYFEMLMERIRQDRYPSHQLMDRLEAAFWTPQQVAEYVDVLLEKVDESWYPSLQLLDRIQRMLALSAAASR